LLFVLSITGCPEVPEDEKNSNKCSLSGDITAYFTVNALPTVEVVTIKLLPDSNTSSPAVYSATADSWRTLKAPPTIYTFFTSYSITGITPGTYYLYAVISPSGNAAYNVYGPASITITANKIQEIIIFK